MKKLTKTPKYITIILITMLASMILLANVNAQPEDPEDFINPNPNQPPIPPPAPEQKAIVVIVGTVGGITEPREGEYTYDFADTITIEAIPDSGFEFQRWIISGTFTPGHNIPPIQYPNEYPIDDPNYVPEFPSPSTLEVNSLTTSTNPLAIICGYGYTYVYQPVFVPTTSNPPSPNNAIVVVVDSIGGTTDPSPGTYFFDEDSSIVLTATPDAGYEFDSWVATGEDGHPVQFTDNPATIICGYGYEFEYQPMFRPIGAVTTDEGIPLYIYGVIGVLAIIAVIGVGAALMYRGRAK